MIYFYFKTTPLLISNINLNCLLIKISLWWIFYTWGSIPKLNIDLLFELISLDKQLDVKSFHLD